MAALRRGACNCAFSLRKLEKCRRRTMSFLSRGDADA
jgi:hypothetical protein